MNGAFQTRSARCKRRGRRCCVSCCVAQLVCNLVCKLSYFSKSASGAKADIPFDAGHTGEQGNAALAAVHAFNNAAGVALWEHSPLTPHVTEGPLRVLQDALLCQAHRRGSEGVAQVVEEARCGDGPSGWTARDIQALRGLETNGRQARSVR